MPLPFALAGWINKQFTDENGDPIANGSVRTLEASTSNLKDTYADADSTSPTVNVNPVPLDADGRATIFLEPGLYDFEIMDASDVVLFTAESVGDIGLTYLSTLGQAAAEGSRDVVSGYTVLDSDNTITVDSTAGPDPCIVNLPAVADRGQDLTIINLGTVELAITPNGAETINFVAAAYTVEPSSSPNLSMITLRPDISSNWLVIAEIVA
jgi:hypothetical protein